MDKEHVWPPPASERAQWILDDIDATRPVSRETIAYVLRGLLAELEAAEKRAESAERERGEAIRSCEHTQRWYAERYRRLRDFADTLPPEKRTEYHAIVANGTGAPHEPPTYAQLLSIAKARAESAERTIATITTALGDWMDGSDGDVARQYTPEGAVLAVLAHVDRLTRQRDARPDITPEDAAIWSADVNTLPFSDDTEVKAALRINVALRAHAGKVVRDA